MQLWRKHPWLLRTVALLSAALVAVLPVHWAPESVQRLEDGLGDLLWRVKSGDIAERRVVLVDIDERSLREVGPWPWPRETMAELANKLQTAQVRVQAFDIAFSDPREGDAQLGAAWQAIHPVVAQVFSLDPGVNPDVGEVAGAMSAAACPASAPQAYGHYGTAPSLLRANPVVGHITPRVGSDGVIRHVPTLICQQGRVYPSLALATLWRASLADPVAPGAASAEAASAAAAMTAAPDWVWHAASAASASSPFGFLLSPPAWLSSESLPGLLVPLDAQGNIRVPYGVSRQAFASVSAAEVLRGEADLGLLRGAIVMVGASAFGIGDTVATPLSAVASGLEVHAQSVVGLLDQSIPYTPRFWPLGQALLMAGLTLLLLGAATSRRVVPAKRLPVLGAALAVLLLLGVVGAFNAGLWLPWWSLVVFALLASVALATVEHALVRAQRERLSAHLGAYLPAPVAERLMATEPSGNLQLEPRKIAVLAAEIRNFNALASHAQPQEVAALLHAYCCMAVEVVEKHGGVVENVVADSVVAIWTAEPEGDAHAHRAVAAARELLQVSRPLLASSHPVSETSQMQPLALGVGVETGSAIVGSFGPARRRAHAALGEPMSVAKRIQQMTADLSIPILVGPQLAAMLPAEAVEPLGAYLLEGLGKDYALFAPIGWADLAPVDSNWAHSVAAPLDKVSDAAEAADWSRWGDDRRAGSAGTSASATLGSISGLRRRTA